MTENMTENMNEKIKMVQNRIHVLPTDLAEKIAAGEVVERPGSIVKELIENSIDAFATNIQIQIWDGGRKKIEIQDNGSGIHFDDLLLALTRHATSKIQNLDDLWQIQTMGFRGEALPSIASVSRLMIESRQESNLGRKLYLEAGKLIQDSPLQKNHQFIDRFSGTSVTIDDLFYNVPARLKFLRSKNSETSFIRELVERLALCNPKTGFSLFSDGRKIFNYPPAKDAGERLSQILDIPLDHIEFFESKFEDIYVSGYWDKTNRATNSQSLYFSVNGRMVRDKLLQQATLTSLRPTMMEGEYPRLFLEVKCPPHNVDVNVHPAKSEVKFHKPRDVFQIIYGALERLAKYPTQTSYIAPISSSNQIQIPEPFVLSSQVNVPAENSSFTFARQATQYSTKSDYAPSTYEYKPQVESIPKPGFFRLQYLGQLKNTYLLFQDDSGLTLIDQHAAHERVQYEKVKSKFLKDGLIAQPLLVSASVKLKADQVALAIDYSDVFLKLGLEIEAFGNDSIIIRTIPQELSDSMALDLFRNLLGLLSDDTINADELSQNDPSRLSPKLERLLSTIACHSSVRAGQALSPTEAIELAKTMDETASSLNCPHGRPSSIKLSFNQIEDLFKRSL